MLAKPVVYSGSMQRQVQRGDTLCGGEVFPATIATNGITITGQQLGSGIIQRTTTGAGTDTIDTAANIIAAISAGLGSNGVQAGTTWHCTWYQNAAYAITVTATAHTGITVNAPTVNASSVKEFLVSVVNGTPASSVTGTTDGTTAVVTGMTQAQTDTLTPGMVCTTSVAGLQDATILSVQSGKGVTMSTVSTSAVTLNAMAFSPQIVLQGLGQKLL